MKRILSHLYILLAVLSIGSAPTQAQNKKKTNVESPSTRQTTIQFNADNPYAKDSGDALGTSLH